VEKRDYYRRIRRGKRGGARIALTRFAGSFRI
jgi:hypothetical protein